MPELPNAQIIADQIAANPAAAAAAIPPYIPLVVVDNMIPLPPGVVSMGDSHDPYYKLEQPAATVDPNMPLV